MYISKKFINEKIGYVFSGRHIVYDWEQFINRKKPLIIIGLSGGGKSTTYTVRDLTSDQIKKLFSGDDRELKKYYGKAIYIGKEEVGHIVLMKNKYGHIEISSVGVDVKYRRKGYLEILLNLYPYAQVLYTEEKNEEARKAYEKYGWVNSKIKGYFDPKDRNHFWYLYYNPKTINKRELNCYIYSSPVPEEYPRL